MHALRGAVIATLLSMARVSQADQDRPFALSYEAPPDCPSAGDLTARVRASTAHARPAVGDEPRYDVSVVVARSESGFLASLQVHAPDGAETSRAVPAPTCSEVIDAVSLIVAMTIDPEAAALEAARQETAAKGAIAESTPPQTQNPSPTEPSKAQEKNEQQKGSKTGGPVVTKAAPSPSTQRSDHYFIDAGLGVVLFAIAPDPTVDFLAGFAFELETDRLFAPRLDLSMHVAESFSVTMPEGRARFERWAGRFNACPIRWGSKSAGLRPCALFEAGYYATVGDQTANGGGNLWPFLWGAPGVFLRGELRSSSRWGGHADLGAVFPLLAGNSFYFDPNQHNVFEIPPVGAFLDLAIEFQIL